MLVRYADDFVIVILFSAEATEALRDLGYEHVGATGDTQATYRITGFYDTKSAMGMGLLLYDGIMFVPGVFFPVPLFDVVQGRISISIYDRAGQRVAKHTTFPPRPQARQIDAEVVEARFHPSGWRGRRARPLVPEATIRPVRT